MADDRVEVGECCASCRYYSPSDNKRSPYDRDCCRRHAPVAITDGPIAGTAVWPDTFESAWCGDWARPVEPAPPAPVPELAPPAPETVREALSYASKLTKKLTHTPGEMTVPDGHLLRAGVDILARAALGGMDAAPEPESPTPEATDAEEALWRMVREELQRARRKFPDARYTLTAATEEHGELARAILRLVDERKPTQVLCDSALVECVQALAALVRVATEGDSSLGLRALLGGTEE